MIEWCAESKIYYEEQLRTGPGSKRNHPQTGKQPVAYLRIMRTAQTVQNEKKTGLKKSAKNSGM